jgi:26S proteasome regulatory subunit N2
MTNNLCSLQTENEAQTAPSTAAPEKKKKKEPSSEVLHNLSRVVPAQMRFIKFREASRYTPVKKVSL